MQAIQPAHASPDPTDRSNRARRRRRALLALAVLLLLLLVAAGSLGGRVPGSGRGETASDTQGAGRTGTNEPGGPGAEGEDADLALDATDDSDTPSGDADLQDGDADGGDPGDADFDPAGDTDPVDPCADHSPDLGSLRVVPDPVVLPNGDYSDELHVRNCGAGSIDWTAATKPSVALAAAAGTLAPGELVDLGFVIDKAAWDPGAIDFKIKVSEPGHNQYIDVHAYRPATGADMVGSNDLSVGPHIGGCAIQCISKALITPAYSTPNVSLEVGTTVKAKVWVYLSKQAPVINPAGNPVFPGMPPKATSPTSAQSWTTSLTNLQPDTRYFIIVKATDVDGDTAYRSGKFRTITPYEGPGELAPADQEPGCANQCITKATVTPGAGLDPAHLSVKTHTPAKIQLFLSRGAPIWEGAVPHFADVDQARNSGDALVESWEYDIHGLDPSTTWHGIIRATDANGHQAYATGSFQTDGVDVRITIYKVHLTQDGDSQDWNRGEITYRWGVGDDTVGTMGEYKLHAGDARGFGTHSTYVVHDANDLPTVYVNALERDADGLSELCTMGTGAFHEPAYNASCDTKWNVGRSEPVEVDDLEDLARCSELDIDGGAGHLPCQLIESRYDLGDDYAEFYTVVSYAVLP